MQDHSQEPEMFAPPVEVKPAEEKPWARRVFDAGVRAWRTAGTVVAILLALMLGWHVINGQHGLSEWEQKRVEDRQLQKEIDDLQQENARLHVHVDKLKSDPDAIEREAREKLRYAKPGEVIVDLSGEMKQPAQSATK